MRRVSRKLYYSIYTGLMNRNQESMPLRWVDQGDPQTCKGTLLAGEGPHQPAEITGGAG